MFVCFAILKQGSVKNVIWTLNWNVFFLICGNNIYESLFQFNMFIAQNFPSCRLHNTENRYPKFFKSRGHFNISTQLMSEIHKKCPWLPRSLGYLFSETVPDAEPGLPPLCLEAYVKWTVLTWSYFTTVSQVKECSVFLSLKKRFWSVNLTCFVSSAILGSLEITATVRPYFRMFPQLNTFFLSSFLRFHHSVFFVVSAGFKAVVDLVYRNQ